MKPNKIVPVLILAPPLNLVSTYSNTSLNLIWVLAYLYSVARSFISPASFPAIHWFFFYLHSVATTQLSYSVPCSSEPNSLKFFGIAPQFLIRTVPQVSLHIMVRQRILEDCHLKVKRERKSASSTIVEYIASSEPYFDRWLRQCVTRGQSRCKFGICSNQKVWVIIWNYGLRDSKVRVKRVRL